MNLTHHAEASGQLVDGVNKVDPVTVDTTIELAVNADAVDGKTFTIEGQKGDTGKNGGDARVVPGAGDGAGKAGDLFLGTLNFSSDRSEEILQDAGVAERLQGIKSYFEGPTTRFINTNYPAGNQGVITLRNSLLSRLGLNGTQESS